MLASSASFGSYDWPTCRSAGVLQEAVRKAVIEVLQGSSAKMPSPFQLWTWSVLPDRVVGRSDSIATASWVSATGGTSESSDAFGSKDSTGAAASGEAAGRRARTAAVVQPAVAATSARIASTCQKLLPERCGGGPGRRTGSTCPGRTRRD